MKLKPVKTPYSGIVGGGLSLVDDAGRPRFMVLLCGTTDGITKQQTTTIADAIMAALPADGIDVPERADEK